MRVAIIGGGTMGEAILKSTLSKGVITRADVRVGERVESRREFLSNEYGVVARGDNREVIPETDLVLLAIKPQELPTLGSQVHGMFAGQVILSILAGTDLGKLHGHLGHDAIVRAMPNMPAQVGHGITVWTASNSVTPDQESMAKSILAALGEQVRVPYEKYVDMATALSGSGPAYVFLFLEALGEAGVYIGLPRDLSELLAVETVLGSTVMARSESLHCAQLKNAVTSPGGTTAEGLLSLERGALRALVIEAVSAAYEKTKRL